MSVCTFHRLFVPVRCYVVLGGPFFFFFFFLNQHSEGMEKVVIDVKKGMVTEHGACHFPEYVFRTGQRVASIGVLT